MDSSDLGQINISESLKETLGSIELTKNNLLASESITSLSALTNNYGNLFNEATEGIITGLEGMKHLNSLKNIITGGTKKRRIRKKDNNVLCPTKLYTPAVASTAY